MAKLFPEIKIDKCSDCPHLIHEDYQDYSCYKLQEKIRNAVDCYVHDEVYINCPLENYMED